MRRLPTACLALLAACGGGDAAAPPARPGVRALQVAGPLGPDVRARLAAAGLRVAGRLGPGRILVAGPRDRLAAAGARPLAVGTKLSPRLARRLATAGGTPIAARVLLAAEPGPGLPLPPELAPARRVGIAPVYAVRLPPAALRRLLRREAVLFGDLPAGRARPLLDRVRATIGADTVHDIDTKTTPPSYDLAGDKTVAAIWDPDGLDARHKDLASRLLRAPRASDALDLAHGTAVAGVIAGTGAASAYRYRGIAPDAKLVYYRQRFDRDASGEVEFDFRKQFVEARDRYRADAVNLSLSFPANPTAGYSVDTANLDQTVAANAGDFPDPVPVVVSAGTLAPSAIRYRTVTSLASGKNVIAVGATDATSDRLYASTAFGGASALGPTRDGRIKPDLVAPGCAGPGKVAFAIKRVRLLRVAGGDVVWDFSRDTLGWRIRTGIDKLTITGGAMQGRTTGDLPGIVSPDKLGARASDFSRVEITMWLERGDRGAFGWRASGGSFGAATQASFKVTPGRTFRTYAVDLTKQPGWRGVVDQLQLVPVASGSGVNVPAPGGGYTRRCGTSISGPAVTGSVLVLTQAYRETYPKAKRALPALYKALLIGTARDLTGSGDGRNLDLGGRATPYGPGPDYATGWGRVDLAGAVALLRTAASGPAPFVTGSLLETGRRFNVRVTVAEVGRGPLRFTLVWDDPAGVPGDLDKPKLVNDLDLTVTDATSTRHLPWVLDPTHPERAARRGVDRRNNVEQVSIASPAAARYVAAVRAHDLAQRPQAFALVVSGAKRIAAVAIDGDGDGAYGKEDCNDRDPRVHPGAKEILGNGRDDDCDPATPDRLPPDAGVRDAAPIPDVRRHGDLIPPTRDRACAVGGGAPGPLSLALLALLLAARRRRAVSPPPRGAPAAPARGAPRSPGRDRAA